MQELIYIALIVIFAIFEYDLQMKKKIDNEAYIRNLFLQSGIAIPYIKNTIILYDKKKKFYLTFENGLYFLSRYDKSGVKLLETGTIKTFKYQIRIINDKSFLTVKNSVALISKKVTGIDARIAVLKKENI